MYDEFGTPVEKERRSNKLPMLATVLILGLLVYQGVRIAGDWTKPALPTPTPVDVVVADVATATPAPTTAPDYLDMGYDAFTDGDFATAVDYYNLALEADSTDATIFIYRADAYYQLGEYERALSDYNRAVEIEPSGWLYNNRGITYAALDEDAKAIADYGRAIADEDNTEPELAYNNRGIIYYEQDDYDAALADYNKALEIRPEYTAAIHNRALVYYAQGETEKAIAEMTTAIEMNPEYALAYFNRGTFYAEQGENNRALLDFNVSLEYDPHYSWAYAGRGDLYYTLGNYQAAIDDYTQALKENSPDTAIIYNSRGITYLDMEDYTKAKTDFDRAITADPEYTSPYINRGWTNFLLGNYEAALPDYEKALELGEDETWLIYDNIAQVYFKLGDTERAFEEWDRTFAANFEYAEAYKTRGDAYFELGKFIEARADYRHYEDLTGELEPYMVERLKAPVTQ